MKRPCSDAYYRDAMLDATAEVHAWLQRLPESYQTRRRTVRIYRGADGRIVGPECIQQSLRDIDELEPVESMRTDPALELVQ